MTFILGLTGSIGMGKSTTAAMFRRAGIPVHDADLSVHGLYRGRAVAAVAALFPAAIRDGTVDRARLRDIVLAEPAALSRLEAVVHPLVRAEEIAFLRAARTARHPVCVLDVPLLFETAGQDRCQAVTVASAPASVQAERVLSRPGMTPDLFATILAKQVPDAEKRRRAHFVVDSGQGLARAERQVRDILRALAGRPGRVSAKDKTT